MEYEQEKDKILDKLENLPFEVCRDILGEYLTYIIIKDYYPEYLISDFENEKIAVEGGIIASCLFNLAMIGKEYKNDDNSKFKEYFKMHFDHTMQTFKNTNQKGHKSNNIT